MSCETAFLTNVIFPTFYVQGYLTIMALPYIIVLEGLIPIHGMRFTAIRKRILVAAGTNTISTLLGAPFAALVFYVVRATARVSGSSGEASVENFANNALAFSDYENQWPIYSCIILAFLLSVVVESYFAAKWLSELERRSVYIWVLIGNVLSYIAVVWYYLFR